MKKIWALFLLIILTSHVFAQNHAPFLDFGNVKGTIPSVKEEIKSDLLEKNFKLIGEYQVQNKSNQYILVFSNQQLQNLTTKDEKSGLLAAAFKVALIQNGTEVNISAINPEYTFLGFLRENYDKQRSGLKNEEQVFVSTLKNITKISSPFGGSLTSEKLKKYRYMVSMPYFRDFVELATFTSFNDGVQTIQENLQKSKGNTKQVYKLTGNNVAVFGVGLLDKSKGESKFLPIIGEKHIAALPYEIFVIGNKAYILHGRFRFAFYWPELKMGTFMKIVSTPGDVEDQLKALTVH